MSGILIPTISEADWLDRRRHGITASEIAIVLGLSPYSSPFELYYRKRGELPPQPDNDAMAIGRAMENYVAGQFGRRHPEFYLTGSGRELYRHSEREWQMATPDRVAFERQLCGSCDAGLPMGCTCETEREGREPLAAVECKVDAGDQFGDEDSGEIPVHYRCQVLWQMDVLSVTTGYLAALLWHKRQVRVYEITMDDQARADLELMRAEALAFLGRIRTGEAPEPDWRPATTAALKHLHPSLDDRHQPVSRQLARSYRAAVRRYEEAKRRREEMTNRLRDAMGSAHFAVTPDGQKVARRDVYPVKEHVRRASTTDKIVPIQPKDKP